MIVVTVAMLLLSLLQHFGIFGSRFRRSLALGVEGVGA